jgi:hypothetical protein
LTEIFDLVRQMRIHLVGEELAQFDAAVAGRATVNVGAVSPPRRVATPSRPGHLTRRRRLRPRSLMPRPSSIPPRHGRFRLRRRHHADLGPLNRKRRPHSRMLGPRYRFRRIESRRLSPGRSP